MDGWALKVQDGAVCAARERVQRRDAARQLQCFHKDAMGGHGLAGGSLWASVLVVQSSRALIQMEGSSAV